MSLEHTNPSMKNCLMPQIPSGRWFYFNSCCDKKGTDSNGFSPLGGYTEAVLGRLGGRLGREVGRPSPGNLDYFR